MPSITNIAAYKFAPLDDLRARRARLIEQCRAWNLKGTILLSPEGINLFVAGDGADIERLLGELRSWPGLAGLQTKVSTTDEQPFNRMLVRLKKEIIAFGVPGIDPAQRTSPKLSAPELKQWLDEGRPITLLDTRNDYEVKLGTFTNARTLGLDHFRNFPAAVQQLPPELKTTPIVMFCTGGIRCEKAGPFMESVGFEHIYQLDGGILKYFEECGSAHYEGECFVFDQRVGVDPALRETDSAQCYVCQSPLTADEQQDERYVVHQSCPYCFRTPAEKMAATLQKRHEEIRHVMTPLPGLEPYDNLRPITIPQEWHGATVLEAFSQLARGCSVDQWQAALDQHLVLNYAQQPVTGDQRVKEGEFYYHKTPGITEPPIDPAIQILHEDEALIVLHKPAPLPMHPGGRYNRHTLQNILNLVYHPQKPRPAHRLDANTTGLVLVTRSRHFAARLQPQFEDGEVVKTYLARVHGHPPQETFRCDAPISETPGEVGRRTVPPTGGLSASTLFRVVRREEDGTALLEVQPLTGRTNQIRVHLWHLGWPICGDPIYRSGSELGDQQTLHPNDPPLCLHAWRLRFNHPLDFSPQEFEAPLPDWAKAGVP